MTSATVQEKKHFPVLQPEVSAPLVNIAKENDDILATLHAVALLLINRSDDWPTRIQSLLAKKLRLPFCRLATFEHDGNRLRRIAANLPAHGLVSPVALPDSPAWREAKVYFYLPLRKKRKNVGLLIMAAKDNTRLCATASRDLACRLAQLLVAAL